MSGILDLLQGQVGQQIIEGVSNSTNQDKEKTSGILAMGLPVLMKAMQRNASTEEGANGLLGALTKHAGGGILDNLTGLFNGGIDEPVKQDGTNILSKVLGDKQEGVTKIIGEKLGVNSSEVGSTLASAAPLLMGMLGKKTQESGVSDANGLTNMLGSLLGGNDNAKEQSFLEKMLDADGDGSVIDDIAGFFTKGNNNSGGMLGGLVGSIFGK